MPVVTTYATIWAFPEPTILFLLYCIKKVFANLYIIYKKLYYPKNKRKKEEEEVDNRYPDVQK